MSAGYCGQDAYNDMFVVEKRYADELGWHTDCTNTNIKELWGGQRMPDKENFNCVIGEDKMETVVRRLTPKECERLQGFPDNWTLIGMPMAKYGENGNVVEIERYYYDTQGKKRKVTDSARYKALGNSIALPFWFWLLRRISAEYETPATLGSLFDGIGGFPLCWERCNGTGTARWASEIEPFCIAVTKQHFGDEDAGIEGDVKEYL